MTRIGSPYDVTGVVTTGRTNTKPSPALRETPPVDTRGPADATPSTVVSLSGGTADKPPSVYAPRSSQQGPMPMMTLNYFSLGDEGPLGGPAGLTRLEYNVYRPDGIAIDGRTSPYTITSTGEPLTDAVGKKYQVMLHEVTKHRIDIYLAGKSDGLSNKQIIAQLQAYDRSLPDSYHALVGSSDWTDPSKRYAQATRDEALGGPVQTE